ncbi:MAG: hypothetical protein ABW162_01750 [Candidatus Sedimenticola sp. PURPLELP]
MAMSGIENMKIEDEDGRLSSRELSGWVVIVLAVALIAILLVSTIAEGAEKTPELSNSKVMPAGQESVLPGSKVSNPFHSWKPPKPSKIEWKPSVTDPEQIKMFEEEWGIKVHTLMIGSGGMMTDFRFRVLDAEKAMPLFDHQTKPYIIALKSNIKLPVPMAAKVGAFRPTNRGNNIKADKNYFMIFGNPDRHLKAGDKVTIVIGDFRAENLVVN